jgi:hypothetical protein
VVDCLQQGIKPVGNALQNVAMKKSVRKKE